MKTACIIQARMSSTRLPGKVLKPLLGRPMLLHVVERVRRAATIDEVIVATTVEPTDQVIETLCMQNGITCFRGSEQDVLDRYYQAAHAACADVVVRVTSDCPLIDPGEIDRVVSALRDRGRDCAYVANSNPVRTYPRGLDTEAFPIGALESAWRDAAQPYEREHVTPYIWQNPTRFPQFCVTNPQDASFHRWTVDTPEDLALTEAIYEHFGHNRFAWTEVLAAFDEHPEWFAINGRIRQKAM